MDLSRPHILPLDYGKAADDTLLANLSGIASAGSLLFTVSDEGRSLECLAPEGDGFALVRTVELDDLIFGIPGREEHRPAELDLESIDYSGGQLFVAGSHCRVRKSPEHADELSPGIRDRPSRNFLARFDVGADGRLERGRALPFSGASGLRGTLAHDRYLDRFLELPSKENGFDIEGLVVRDGGVLLGLRGPLLDSTAVVVSLRLDADFAIASYDLSFLDLGGLGIRDLTRLGDDVLVLAGPMAEAASPFRLYRWTPEGGDGRVHAPLLAASFPAGMEKPEGICRLDRNGVDGLAILYDRPDRWRTGGSRYAADWIAL